MGRSSRPDIPGHYITFPGQTARGRRPDQASGPPRIGSLTVSGHDGLAAIEDEAVITGRGLRCEDMDEHLQDRTGLTPEERGDIMLDHGSCGIMIRRVARSRQDAIRTARSPCPS